MSFSSQYADRIWNKLYKVKIPDQASLSPEYIRRYGVYTSDIPEIKQMMETNFIDVMIPVSKILEYYMDGLEIQIPCREDMITMHKDIELYLAEWRYHLKMEINVSTDKSKDLLLALERLSKYIYEKAKPREVIDNLFVKKQFGLMSPIQASIDERKEVSKPDYHGISDLVRSKRSKPVSRF